MNFDINNKLVVSLEELFSEMDAYSSNWKCWHHFSFCSEFLAARSASSVAVYSFFSSLQLHLADVFTVWRTNGNKNGHTFFEKTIHCCENEREEKMSYRGRCWVDRVKKRYWRKYEHEKAKHSTILQLGKAQYSKLKSVCVLQHNFVHPQCCRIRATTILLHNFFGFSLFTRFDTYRCASVEFHLASIRKWAQKTCLYFSLLISNGKHCYRSSGTMGTMQTE